jgi:membrane protein YqaA with SNARE-associated domain
MRVNGSAEITVRLLQRLNQYLLYLGIPGVFVIAFLDSAAIPMAGGPDAVLMLLSWHRPAMAWLITLCAAAGSTLGCIVLYFIGRGGGELTLEKFSEQRRVWVREKLDRNAFWTVLAAVIAPPPLPTKLVILAAGVFRIRLAGFTAGVAVGRLLRYGLEAYLGARFGDQAAMILKRQYPIVSVVFIGIIVIMVLIRRLRLRAQNNRP